MYLISGMHRSGTSLVARFFFEAGADLGDSRTFYRPDRWNPDGYFEQPEIHAINMPLINGPWGKFSYLCLPSTKTVLRRGERLRDQMTETGAKYQHKVVKETRFCLTLPAWRQLGTDIEGVIICLRHPTEVARSLQRRNRITHSISYRLWRIHLERLLEHTQDVPTRFVLYENVLDDQLVVQELRAAIQSVGVSCDPQGIRRLHGDLVRARPASAVRNRPSLPPAASKLWNQLLEKHASQI